MKKKNIGMTDKIGETRYCWGCERCSIVAPGTDDEGWLCADRWDEPENCLGELWVTHMEVKTCPLIEDGGEMR